MAEILLCGECERALHECDQCRKLFIHKDELYCMSLGVMHKCENCIDLAVVKTEAITMKEAGLED